VDKGQDESDTEIQNRWLNTINKRLRLDRALTNRRVYESKALHHRLVRETWEQVVEYKEDLPENWVGQMGVLVGIGRTGRRKPP